MVVNLIACAAAVACGLGPLDGSRSAPQPVVVLDRSLHATTGELVSLRDGAAVVKVAGKDVTVERPVALVVASLWGPERDWPGLPKEPSSLSGGVTVELTDGSLLRGDLLAGKGDGLVLVHKRLGKVEFPLDALSMLTVKEGDGGNRDRGARRSADTVLLANGDRLEGFVDSIGPLKEGDGTALAVTIERTGEKTKTAVPLERVASVTMSGGAGGSAKPASLIWLAGAGGQERTAAVEFSIEKREARVVRAKGSLAARVDGGAIDGALLDAGAVVPLASCAAKGSIEVGPDQPLGTRDIALPEPESVSWVLPAGAARISGWAVLPEECRRWGDCDVTVSVVGTEKPLLAFTLNGATPVAAIDCELPPAKGAVTLSVVVGEGKHGPVQDRVVLRHVLVGIGGK